MPDGRIFELDIFIPGISLAFEYQGEQHFVDVEYLGSSAESIKSLDRKKRQACQDVSITLIEIPYWWDRKKESIVATIRSIRNDLCKDIDIKGSVAISDEPMIKKKVDNR